MIIPGDLATRETDPASLLTIPHERYMDLAKSAKVMSFDVFDTLIHRRVLLPRHIFAVVGARAGLPDFEEQRFAAEARARRLARPQTHETSLDEIYAAFPAGYLADPDRVKQLELDAEHEFTFANGAMRATVNELRAKGCRVVAISDIYLDREQVGSLLRASDIHVDAVYTSADHRHDDLGKYNGRLFPEVCRVEQVDPGAMLHVGDHAGSDVSNALSNGLVAVQSDHPNAFLAASCGHFPAIAAAHGNLTTSLVAGTIARSKLDDVSRLTSTIESYGYDFGGPLVVGMVTHMLERCRALGIDHLVLLARDGCVVRDVLDILKPEGITYRVMPASRRLAVFPSYATGGFAKIKSLFAGQKRLSKRQILAILRLDHLAEGIANSDEVMDVRAATMEMDALLRAQASDELAALKACLAPELGMLAEGKKFAWVDVGWALSSPARLNELLGHDIPGFFIGSHGAANPSKGFEGYLFTRGKPHNLAKKAMRSVELFELIYADWMPSAAYLKQGPSGVETVHYEKSAAETVRDAHIKAARRGVRMFAEDIRPVFDLLNPAELRAYNARIWGELCASPPKSLYKMLSAIPHDALAGTRTWKTIGDYWMPNWRYAKPDAKLFPSKRSYRTTYLRRYLKWHLPPSAWRLANKIDAMLRKHI